MAILVTGGAGYIGSHTIIELLERTDYEVISADNYLNSSSRTYDRIKQISGKDIKHYEIDLVDIDACRSLFQKENIEGIIHFAALKSAPESVEQPLVYFRNNLNSLINIIECQKEFNVSSLIFSSSCSVYGNADELPVTEETPTQETESPYGSSKKMGEGILKDAIGRQNIIAAIALRYFNPVGAHESGLLGEASFGRPNNLVPFITQTAIGEQEQLTIFGHDYNTPDGTCIRDYIHVSDIASAHVLALNYLRNKENKSSYEIFNLGSGKGVSVLEAVKAFEQTTGVSLNYHLGDRREGDVEAVYANNEKAKERLGWRIQYGIEEMMSSAWKWQQNLSEEV